MDASRPVGISKALLAAATLGAVVLLAMVPAFACTPTATTKIEPARGEAGTVAQISGNLFKPEFGDVVVKWGGASGLLLATIAVNPDGTFGPAPVTVPADAERGRTFVVSVYQPADPSARVSNAVFTTAGEPVAATPAPAFAAPQPEPAAVAQAVPAESSQPAPAMTTPPAPQVRARPVPAAPAPVTAAPAPAAVAAPVAQAPAPVPVPPVPPAVEVPEVADTDPFARSESPAASGPRSAAPAGSTEIDDGPSLWVAVPLVAVGITLFAGSAAFVVHEVRRRRQAVKA